MATNTAHQVQPWPLSASEYLIDSMDRATHVKQPYDHWLLTDMLPESLVEDVLALPFAPPPIVAFGGSRESNNSTRVYFSRENQEKYPVCRQIVEVFTDPTVKATFQETTGADLSKGQLRIEYCQDVSGFWLAPHPDISVKLFTMMFYLSDDPNLADAGTDIYGPAPDFKPLGRAPYGENKAMIFIPSENTMLGYTRRPINGIRKSLMINYVSPEWRNVDELAAYPTT